MTSFDRAHAFVARWEGGFVNHPSDPGGATNHGVSLRWLRSIGMDVNGDGDITVDDVRALSPGMAKDLFHTHFWRPCACGAFSLMAATVLYDGAVNMGVSRSVRLMQRACNSFPGQRLAEDGRMGPLTRERVYDDFPTPGRELDLCRAALDERDAFYRRLAKEPRYRPFLRGWLNRTAALRDFLVQIHAEHIR